MFLVVLQAQGRQRCAGQRARCNTLCVARSMLIVATWSLSFTCARRLQTPPSVLWTRTRLPTSAIGPSVSSPWPHGHCLEVQYSSSRTVTVRVAKRFSNFFLGIDGLPRTVHENVPSPKKTVRRAPSLWSRCSCNLDIFETVDIFEKPVRRPI